MFDKILVAIDGSPGFLECIANSDSTDIDTGDSATVDAKAKAYAAYDSELANA